jgi:hypothetical protein
VAQREVVPRSRSCCDGDHKKCRCGQIAMTARKWVTGPPNADLCGLNHVTEVAREFIGRR